MKFNYISVSLILCYRTASTFELTSLPVLSPFSRRFRITKCDFPHVQVDLANYNSRCKPRIAVAFMASGEEDSDGEGRGITSSPAGRYSSKRAGGRVKNKNKDNVEEAKYNSNPIVNFVSKLLGLLLLLKVASSLLFGGFSNSGNFVYYESSTYEMTTRNVDGKIETTRKQSIKSNLPGLKQDLQNTKDVGRMIELEQQQVDAEVNRIVNDFYRY